MTPYHKIPTIFKRDPETKYKTLLVGEFATPELSYLSVNQWLFTEKIDGTNIRIVWDPELRVVQFKGRTDNAQIPPFLLDKLRETFYPARFTKYDYPLTLYGEGFGARIHGGGKYNPDGVDFILFDVRVGKYWLQWDDVIDVAKYVGCMFVPELGGGTLFDAVGRVVMGLTSYFGDFQAEGIVARPVVQMFDRRGERIIAKIKVKDFDNGKE